MPISRPIRGASAGGASAATAGLRTIAWFREDHVGQRNFCPKGDADPSAGIRFFCIISKVVQSQGRTYTPTKYTGLRRRGSRRRGSRTLGSLCGAMFLRGDRDGLYVWPYPHCTMHHAPCTIHVRLDRASVIELMYLNRFRIGAVGNRWGVSRASEET